MLGYREYDGNAVGDVGDVGDVGCFYFFMRNVRLSSSI